jgi:hypothetical protein
MLQRLVPRKVIAAIPGNHLALPWNLIKYLSLWEILLGDYPYRYRLQGGVRRHSQPFTTTHPPFVLLTAGHSSFLTRISYISDMSQPSSSISFKGVFDAALQEYENQTEIKLADHSLAQKLKACDTVDDITAILQEQAQIFGKFKDGGKIMKSLRPSVGVLSALFNNASLGQVVGLIVHTKSSILVHCS